LLRQTSTLAAIFFAFLAKLNLSWTVICEESEGKEVNKTTEGKISKKIKEYDHYDKLQG